MMRLAFLLSLAALPAGAEGRNDPFLRCTFDGAEVTLAESGAAILWRDETGEVPARCIGQGADIAGCMADTAGGPSFLALATGNGTLPPGSASLTRATGAAGLKTHTTNGTCQALIP